MRNVNKSKANRKFKADIFRPKKQDIILIKRYNLENKDDIYTTFFLYVNKFEYGVPISYIINEYIYTRYPNIEKFDIVSNLEYSETHWDKSDFKFTAEVLASNKKFEEAYDYVTTTLPEYFI